MMLIKFFPPRPRLIAPVVFILLLVLLFCQHSYALDCDAISRLAEYGIIGEESFTYGNNSVVNDNPIAGDGNTPTPTGDVTTANLSFPPFEPATFPSGGSNVDNAISLVPGATYGKVTVQNNRTIILEPGSYYINEFEPGNGVTIVTSPIGKVELYIGKHLKAGNGLVVNRDGNFANFIIYLYAGTEINIGNGDQGHSEFDFNGMIYSPYADTKIEFGNNNTIQGAILSAGTIKVGNNTDFNYSAEVQEELLGNFGCDAVPVLDHIRIEHSGQGLTCMAESITVKACLDEECSTFYEGATLEMTASGSGYWVGENPRFLPSGEGKFYLRGPKKDELVTVGATVINPAGTSSVTCLNTSTGTDSCDIFFAESGFIVSIPDGRSCTPLSGTIQAVKADDEDDENKRCVGDYSFADRSEEIGFWVPLNGGSEPPEINGIPLDAASPGTPSIPIVFNNQATGTFSFEYNDAGSLELYARFKGSGDEADLLMTGNTSAPIVIAPDRFEVTSLLDNSGSSDDPKLAAGNNFSATITAVCADGTPTPNFAAATTLAAIDPFVPATGFLGTLGGGVLGAGDFVDGAAEPADLTYSEVGNFTLQAQALNYLNSGMNVEGSALVGRFTPHHFTVSANEPTLLASCSGFSYLDQAIEYGTVPVITITARNRSGVTTTNYQGDWWKLVDITETYVDTVKPATVFIDSTLASHLPPTTKYHGSAGQVVITFDGPLAYQRPVGGNAAPFNADMKMSFVVEDGDASYDGGNPFQLSLTFDSATDNVVRHGRLLLNNAYGSELLPLSMPLTIEYFDGSSFIPNTFDSCTLPVLGQFTFSSPDGIADADSVTMVSGGTGSLDWTNPPYPGGYVDVTVNLSPTPWLRFDWDDDGSHDDDPPGVRATFGIYKGNPRIIYTRESVW